MSSGDPIREYILRTRELYTREAIDARLRESNHSASDIEAAWQSLREDDTAGSRDPAQGPETGGFRRWFVPYVILLNLTAFGLFAFFSDLPKGMFGAIGMVILGVVLVLGTLMGFLVVSRTGAGRRAAQGITAGLAVALLVPFVITVVIAGVCIQTTRPAFG